jgi:hypothetical protein
MLMGWCNTDMVEDLFGWDEVAAAYAGRFSDELDAKPFDRKLLDWLVERADPIGPICDLGCGPGQVDPAGLATAGVDVCGDLARAASQVADRSDRSDRVGSFD